ncbi:MAG: hypothetical protein QM809_07455 [Gordonia sp. (in: high G+C Gram-positive bacteria)]|uniref:hypothetical protein n=1 Tax=Gordonia sp. (in: high G+C Gram-positive bacteria) TaxID=84139 RepID=UPI0039E40531
MTSPTPPPIAFLPGEVVIRQYQFTPRLILVYLKTTMILTDRRLVVSSPNTIFGFIPHGYSIHAAPLENISDIAYGNGRETGMLGRLLILLIPLAVVLLLGFSFFSASLGYF